jgi:hypothetical protein
MRFFSQYKLYFSQQLSILSSLSLILISELLPFGFAVVVDVDSVEVDVITVELVGVSSMQRLSPEMQFSQDLSMVGQFLKRMHSDSAEKKVNHRHPRVESQS